VINLVTTSESVGGYQLRAWSGIAVDEGVGLIALVEVSDGSGRPVCRFEEFLDAAIQRTGPAWPRDDAEAARLLQERAVERARGGVLGNTLDALNGHRFDV
jgi:hypothetical protein